ncbi:cupin domain-containing protein [Marinobacter halodurans]|uniref:Cupin domain-containing protein n=2 Tax=Marinobacter halodurans TaxID=2528979 RepID=A0ABY1ZFK0_9GAMM|nr:cupin domain-containing protein [Marinobacter halodurans]
MARASIRSPDESREYFFEEGCFILELSNSDDDPALSIARARVAPGRTTRLHRLARQVERYVILAGEGWVEVGDAVSGPVAAGDVVTIPAGAVQRIRNTGSGDLVFLALCTPRFSPEDYTDIDPAPSAPDADRD